MKKFLITISILLFGNICFAVDITKYDIQSPQTKTSVEYATYAIQNTLDNIIIPMNKKMDYEGQIYYWGSIMEVYEDQIESLDKNVVLPGKYNNKQKLYKAILKESIIQGLGYTGLDLDPGCEGGLEKSYQQHYNEHYSYYVDVRQFTTMEQLGLAQAVVTQILAFKTGKLKFADSPSYNKYVVMLIALAENMSGQPRRVVAATTLSLVKQKGTDEIEQLINRKLIPMANGQ